jgi:hypothetical protein
VDVGDAAAWTGDGVAVIAVLISVLTARQSKTAKQSAARSEARADSVADSNRRMADNLAEQNQIFRALLPADDRQVAPPNLPDQRSRPERLPFTSPEAPTVRHTETAVAFSLELGKALDTYVLRNVGTRAALDVTLSFKFDGRHLGDTTYRFPVIRAFQGETFKLPLAAKTLGARTVTITASQTPPVDVELPRAG